MIRNNFRRLVICLLVWGLLATLIPPPLTHAQQQQIGSISPGNACGALYIYVYDQGGGNVRFEQTIVRYSYVSMASASYTLRWTNSTRGTSGSVPLWIDVGAPDYTQTSSYTHFVGSGTVQFDLSGTFSTSAGSCSLQTTAIINVGIVTRSGIYSSSYEAWQAFDGTTSTFWLSNMYTSSVWIGYEWGGGATKVVTSYQIKYANGSCCEQRGPKNWTLQGWNGAAWVVVDTVTNQTGWYANGSRTYVVDTPGSYSRYQLNVTADNYNDLTYPITLVSIAEIQFYGY